MNVCFNFLRRGGPGSSRIARWIVRAGQPNQKLNDSSAMNRLGGATYSCASPISLSAT